MKPRRSEFRAALRAATTTRPRPPGRRMPPGTMGSRERPREVAARERRPAPTLRSPPPSTGPPASRCRSCSGQSHRSGRSRTAPEAQGGVPGSLRLVGCRCQFLRSPGPRPLLVSLLATLAPRCPHPRSNASPAFPDWIPMPRWVGARRPPGGIVAVARTCPAGGAAVPREAPARDAVRSAPSRWAATSRRWQLRAPPNRLARERYSDGFGSSWRPGEWRGLLPRTRRSTSTSHPAPGGVTGTAGEPCQPSLAVRRGRTPELVPTGAPLSPRTRETRRAGQAKRALGAPTAEVSLSAREPGDAE